MACSRASAAVWASVLDFDILATHAFLGDFGVVLDDARYYRRLVIECQIPGPSLLREQKSKVISYHTNHTNRSTRNEVTTYRVPGTGIYTFAQPVAPTSRVLTVSAVRTS